MKQKTLSDIVLSNVFEGLFMVYILDNESLVEDMRNGIRFIIEHLPWNFGKS